MLSLFWCCLHYESNAWLLQKVKQYKGISKFSLWSNMGPTVLNIPWGGEKCFFFIQRTEGLFPILMSACVHVGVHTHMHKVYLFYCSNPICPHFFLPPEISSFDRHTLKSLTIIILSHQSMKIEIEESYNNELRCKS